MAIKIGEKEYSPEQIEALADAGVLNIAQKNDPASTTLVGSNLHGPLQSGTDYGPLSQAGRKPGMLSTLVRAESLLANLPFLQSDVANEVIGVMTGVTEETGTNASGWCGNPPAPGALKKCDQQYVFGKYYVKTDLNAVAEIGLRAHRADIPRDILNAGPNANPIIPEGAFLRDTFSQWNYEMFKVGVGAERSFANVAINGLTATAYTSTDWGFIKEFAGLDGQIKTGYTDISGTTCPAADSIVESFNVLISSTDSYSRSFTEAMQDIAWGLEARASAMGMAGTTWAIVMRRELFYRASQEIAINMPTARGGVLDNGAYALDPQEAMRLQFLRGRFLTLNGVDYPVIIDDGINQETLANQTYKSDIYFVPLNWAGMPLTYMQYFDMGNRYSLEYTDALGMGDVRRWNNGLWLVGKRDTGLCIEYHFQSMLRLILEAPFLAGRLDDVWYTYLPKSRSAMPGASLYANGGLSYIDVTDSTYTVR